MEAVLCKAFDTVNHEILLSKLKAIGIDSVSWFESYLSGREQCVEIGGTRSDFLPVTCGVPQGSILGPQLFLVYINDLSISVNCDLSLYADDSALIFSGKDPQYVAAHLSNELGKCKQWLIDNRLSLHVGKTESILFGSARKLKRAGMFQVTCDGAPVKRVSSVKYLGVTLDESLSGKPHAENVIKKCGGRVSFLFRHASILNFKSRITLCSALIQPFLDYCSSSWYSGLTQKLKCRLDVIQRRMIRFVFGMHHMEHVDFKQNLNLSWLSVCDRVNYFKLCLVFKVKAGKAPPYLSDSFTPVSSTHTHSTRGSHAHNFAITREIASSPSSFSLTSIKAWNDLPAHIKLIDSESTFRTSLKAHFLSKYS